MLRAFINYCHKRLFLIIGTILLFAGCQKQEETPGAWTRLADFPGASRKYAGSVSLNGKGYVFFGTDDKFDQLNDVWEFDPSKKSWTKIAEYLENLYAGPVICQSVNNKIYLLMTSPSYDNTVDDRLVTFILTFNPADKSFSKIPIPQDVKVRTTLLIANNRYLYFAGDAGKLYRYDSEKNEWSLIPFLEQEDYPAIGSSNYTVPSFLHNGMVRLINSDGVFWTFDSVNEKWISQGRFSQFDGRFGMSTVNIRDYFYFICGELRSSGAVSKRVFRYHPDTNAMKELSEFPSSDRAGSSGFVIDGTAYVCMGGSLSTSKEVWQFKGDEK